MECSLKAQIPPILKLYIANDPFPSLFHHDCTHRQLLACGTLRYGPRLLHYTFHIQLEPMIIHFTGPSRRPQRAAGEGAPARGSRLVILIPQNLIHDCS